MCFTYHWHAFHALTTQQLDTEGGDAAGVFTFNSESAGQENHIPGFPTGRMLEHVAVCKDKRQHRFICKWSVS
jgi:hypothetical protein